MSNRIIQIAEAIGGPIWEAYIDPGRCPEEINLPDPFTDANACNALITHIIEKIDGVVEVSHKKGDCFVSMYGAHQKEITWTGSDWRHGVCELALKVIAAHSGRDSND